MTPAPRSRFAALTATGLLLAGLASCRPEGELIAAYPLHDSLRDTGPAGCGLQQVGAVTWRAASGPGFPHGMAGPFSDDRFPTGAPCLIRSMQGLAAWSVSGTFQVTEFTIDPGIVEIFSSSRCTFLLQVMTDGTPRVASTVSTVADGRPGLVQSGIPYRFVLAGDATSLRAWVSPADDPDPEPAVTMDTDARLSRPITSINFGRLAVAPGRVLDGYLADVTIRRGAFTPPDPTSR